MKTSTKFLIVEDDLLIAETISEILSVAGYKNIRSAIGVEEAIREIEAEKPTMVLTDIELGQQKNGIDLGSMLQLKYHIPFIYITSFSSPEILNKAKHTRPNAYIIKPFKNEDLLVAIELALFNTSQKVHNTDSNSELVVKEGRAMVRIDVDNVKWLENEGNYSTINLTNQKRRVIRSTLAELQEQLPAEQFIRIHRSYVVNKKHVSEVHPNSVVIDGQEFPIGRTYQQQVREFFT